MPTFDCEYAYTKPGNIVQANNGSEMSLETDTLTVSVDDPDDGEDINALINKEVGTYVSEVYGRKSKEGMRMFLKVTKSTQRE